MQSMKDTYDPPRPQWQKFAALYIVAVACSLSTAKVWDNYARPRTVRAVRRLGVWVETR